MTCATVPNTATAEPIPRAHTVFRATSDLSFCDWRDGNVWVACDRTCFRHVAWCFGERVRRIRRWQTQQGAGVSPDTSDQHGLEQNADRRFYSAQDHKTNHYFALFVDLLKSSDSVKSLKSAILIMVVLGAGPAVIQWINMDQFPCETNSHPYPNKCATHSVCPPMYKSRTRRKRRCGPGTPVFTAGFATAALG